jgi:PLD-like domain
VEIESKRQGDRIRALLRGAKNEVSIIAPFIKTGALKSLLEAIPAHVHVRCITRWLPKDIAAGVSDPEIIDLLEQRGHFSLSLVDILHAKIYIADKTCLAGSANVTQPGLGGTDAQTNIEILVETTVDDSSVAETLEAISKTERQASQFDAETARRLADSFRPLTTLASDDAVWFPRSRKPERAYAFYRKPPTGYLGAIDQLLLEDVASANIQPGLSKRDFRLAVRTLLKKIPLAKLLLGGKKDMMLTKAEASPYIVSMAGTEFTTEDLWLAFINWMSFYLEDVVMKQEVTEIALRRAQVLRQ